MAFLGINISPDVGKILHQIPVSGKREDTSEYHITLAYFGKNWKLDQISQVMEVVFEELENVSPFSASVNEIDCFSVEDKNEPIPIIAKVKSQDLHHLNIQLKNRFDQENIEYSKVHKDFKPHITLSYAEEKIDKFNIDKIEFMISQLTLHCGDYGNNRLFITFDLQQDHSTKKSSFLIQKTEVFRKIAENSPQVHFTATKERRK